MKIRKISTEKCKETFLHPKCLVFFGGGSLEKFFIVKTWLWPQQLTLLSFRNSKEKLLAVDDFWPFIFFLQLFFYYNKSVVFEILVDLFKWTKVNARTSIGGRCGTIISLGLLLKEVRTLRITPPHYCRVTTGLPTPGPARIFVFSCQVSKPPHIAQGYIYQGLHKSIVHSGLYFQASSFDTPTQFTQLTVWGCLLAKEP